MVSFMIWKLHMKQFVLDILMLFGKEFAETLFSMLYYSIISEYDFIKINSYDSPPSSNHDHQRASPHDLCLQHFDALMHDLGIHNIFTKFITKKLFIQFIQVKKKTILRNFYHLYVLCILEGGFSP